MAVGTMFGNELKRWQGVEGQHGRGFATDATRPECL